MSNEQKAESTNNVGSSDLIKSGPSVNTPGAEGEPNTANASGNSPDEAKVDMDKYVPRETYEELEKKLGEQGTEVGDFRKFFNEVSPLLDKLQAMPDVVEAIMEGQIDSKLAKAVSEGKIKIEEATDVAAAHEEVKKEMGEKKYDQASPAVISKLVEEQVAKMRDSLQKDIKNSEEKRKFADETNEFIKSTPDFSEYSDQIVTYLEEHPEIYDISIAYDVVKGKALIEKSNKEDDAKAAENAKDIASNAGGGGSQGGKMLQGKDIIDDLIAHKSNPNIY